MGVDTTKPNRDQNFGDVIDSVKENFIQGKIHSDNNENRIKSHELNIEDAHGINDLKVSTLSYENHQLNTENAHGIDQIKGQVSAFKSELEQSRGTKLKLAQRLDVSLQGDGIIKLSSLQTRWIDNNDTATFASELSFTVPGDRTKVYLPGVIVRATLNTGYVYGIVESSSFTTVTTIVLTNDYPVLDTSVSKIEMALYAFAGNLENAIAQNAANIIDLQNQITTYMVSGIQSVSDVYTVQPNDRILLIDCMAKNIPVNLPDPETCSKRQIIVKKIDASENYALFNRPIDGNASATITNKNEVFRVISDGTQWLKI